MTRVYLVRHCEAQGNLDRIFHGITDTDVTEQGKKQLEALAVRFKNIPIDVVYASPLKRTVATAKAINKYHNCEIITDKRIIEIDGGDIEGVSLDIVTRDFAELWNVYLNDIANYLPENGESTRDVAERGYNAIRDIVSKNKNKNIAIATHGAFIRMCIPLLAGYELSEIVNIKWMENTGITALDFDDDLNCTVRCYDDCLHIEQSGLELFCLWAEEEAGIKYPLSEKWGNSLGENK